MPAVKATAPDAAADGGDKSLPDPTSGAKAVLAGVLVIAFILTVVANAAGWSASPFKPSADKTANFGLFAGFYVAAQVIERLMEFITPFLPWPGWTLPHSLKPADAAGAVAANSAAALKTVTAVYLKADRVLVALGVASLLGVAASFFLVSTSCKPLVCRRQERSIPSSLGSPSEQVQSRSMI